MQRYKLDSFRITDILLTHRDHFKPTSVPQIAGEQRSVFPVVAGCDAVKDYEEVFTVVHLEKDKKAD